MFTYLGYPESPYHPTVLGQFSESLQHKISTGKSVPSQFIKRQMSYRVGKSTICKSENKDTDQLRSHCEADLRLCFRLCRLLVFPCGGSNHFGTRE